MYSNLISTKEFGNYSLLMSVFAVVSVVYQFGMYAALNKFYIEEENEEKKKIIFSSILNAIFIIGILLTAGLSIEANEISKAIFSTGDFSFLLILLFVTLVIETLNFYIIYLLKTKELPKQTVIYSLIGASGNLLLNIIFVYFLGLSIEGIILAQLLSSIVLLVFALRILKGNYFFALDSGIMKMVLRFSIPMVLANLLTVGINVADRFLINIFMGREDVGIYSFAYRIALVMNLFVVSFSSAWNPYSLNQYYSGKYKNSFGKVFTHLIAVSSLILIAASLLVGDLFDLRAFNISLFNPIYKPGVIILPFILAGYIFNGISAFYAVYPFVSNKTYHLLLADLVSFIINISLNVLLIPTIGYVGAAVATTAAFMGGALYLLLLGRNKIAIDYEHKNLSIILMGGVIVFSFGMYFNNPISDIILLAGYLLAIVKICKIELLKFKLISR